MALEHRITCGVCGCEYDPADLNQVIYHAQVPHRPVEAVQYASLRIDALPEWVQKCRRNLDVVGMRKMIRSAAEMVDRLEDAGKTLKQLNNCESVKCDECEPCPGHPICMCCLQIDDVLRKWDEGAW